MNTEPPEARHAWICGIGSGLSNGPVHLISSGSRALGRARAAGLARYAQEESFRPYRPADPEYFRCADCLGIPDGWTSAVAQACVGVPVGDAERKDTFCKYPVATGKPLVVTDALMDPVLSLNPHVLAEGGIRFYAGVPLTTHDGHTIGTVCAVGYQPRQFSAVQLQILTDLAAVTMHEIELRQQAETDVLTGLLSRRAFKHQGGRAVALARRHSHPLTCAAIDIDHSRW